MENKKFTNVVIALAVCLVIGLYFIKSAHAVDDGGCVPSFWEWLRRILGI